MGRQKPGKPRKERSQYAEGSIFWLPMKHICGCYLAWGCETGPYSPQQRRMVALHAGATIEQFLRRAHAYPCPMHGSASGNPAPPLSPGEQRYIPGSNAWYMTCPPDEYEAAERRGHEIMRLGSVLYYPDGSDKS